MPGYARATYDEPPSGNRKRQKRRVKERNRGYRRDYRTMMQRKRGVGGRNAAVDV